MPYESQAYQSYQTEGAVPKPVYYAEPSKEERTDKPAKKKGFKKLIAMLVIVALLAGIAGTLSLFYQIVPGDGSTVFSLTRRGQESGASDNGNKLQVNPGNNSSGKDQSGTKATGSSDGPQMQINGAPSSPAPSTLTNSNGEALTVSEIAAKVMPSVVGVVSNVESQYGTATYSGTGIIMSADGYIITNNHVINGAKTITITLMDKKTYEGKLIGADARSDLAVVKIDATGLTPAEFGDSDALHVGDPAVAIGNPLGLELTPPATPSAR
jgi:serine protease Do